MLRRHAGHAGRRAAAAFYRSSGVGGGRGGGGYPPLPGGWSRVDEGGEEHVGAEDVDDVVKYLAVFFSGPDAEVVRGVRQYSVRQWKVRNALCARA